MKYYFFNKGNSLIELIVYLAIFSILCLVIIRSLITAMTIYSQAQGYKKLQTQGELVMERFTREIRQATTASGTYDTNPGSLTLTGKDINGVAQTVAFGIANGKVTVSVNGGVQSQLTGGNIAPTSLIFRNVVTTKGTAIKVELVLATTTGGSISAPFQTTVFLRGK